MHKRERNLKKCIRGKWSLNHKTASVGRDERIPYKMLKAYGRWSDSLENPSEYERSIVKAKIQVREQSSKSYNRLTL